MTWFSKLKPHKAKHAAATNALLAEHVLGYIEIVPENPFVGELKNAVVQVWRYSGFPNMTVDQVCDRFNSMTRFQQLNFLAMAFNELGHHPMLENESWRPVKNPLLGGLDDPANIEAASIELLSKHGVEVRIPNEVLDIRTW